MSLYQWKSLLLLTSTIAIEEIRQSEVKSAATRSRRCITINDTNDSRYAKALSYCLTGGRKIKRAINWKYIGDYPEGWHVILEHPHEKPAFGR